MSCGTCRHYLKRPAVNYGDCAAAERREAEIRMPSLLSVIVYDYEGADCRAFEPGKAQPKPAEEPRRRKKRAHKGIDAMTAPGMGAVEAEDDGD